MTEGPFKGCQAVVMRPAEPFLSVKLPAELRNRIYRELLTLPPKSLAPRAGLLSPGSLPPIWPGLSPSPSIKIDAGEFFKDGG